MPGLQKFELFITYFHEILCPNSELFPEYLNPSEIFQKFKLFTIFFHKKIILNFHYFFHITSFVINWKTPRLKYLKKNSNSFFRENIWWTEFRLKESHPWVAKVWAVHQLFLRIPNSKSWFLRIIFPSKHSKLPTTILLIGLIICEKFRIISNWKFVKTCGEQIQLCTKNHVSTDCFSF